MKSEIGVRIQDLLRKKGLSQRELAEQCNITEVSMSRYINGSRIPKGPIVAAMANVLGTTTDYILGSEKELDFESEYYKLHRTITRMAPKMTMTQKRELIDAILSEADNL